MAFNFNDYNMREEAHKDVKYFESKFEARIEDSKEYKQYVRRMPYDMWDGKIPFNVEVQTAPMKAIHLTTDNLDRLVREQELMDHLKSDAEYGKKLCNMLREDERIRDANPAVAKAYRNYLTLLEVCRK
jgi:hypothetical protein